MIFICVTPAFYGGRRIEPGQAFEAPFSEDLNWAVPLAQYRPSMIEPVEVFVPRSSDFVRNSKLAGEQHGPDRRVDGDIASPPPSGPQTIVVPGSKTW